MDARTPVRDETLRLDDDDDDAMATPMEAFAAMQRKLREDSKTYESLSEGACDSMTTTTTTTSRKDGCGQWMRGFFVGFCCEE